MAQALSTSSDWCLRHSKEAAAKGQLEEEISALKLWVHVKHMFSFHAVKRHDVCSSLRPKIHSHISLVLKNFFLIEFRFFFNGFETCKGGQNFSQHRSNSSSISLD